MSSGPRVRWETPDLDSYFLGTSSHLSIVMFLPEDPVLQSLVVWDPDEAKFLQSSWMAQNNGEGGSPLGNVDGLNLPLC